MPSPSRFVIVAVLLCGAASAVAQELRVQYPRMYTVNYDPWLETTSERVHDFGGWIDPSWLNNEYLNDYVTSTHGLVKFRQTVELNLDQYPIQQDGFRYTDASYTAAVNQWFSGGGQGGFHEGSTVNYKTLSRDFDFARRVDFGEIDEVNNNCAPFFAYWETNMSGYGGYWCNSGPTRRVPCSRIYVITGFNYERGVAEMLHSNGHRTESVMSRTYLSWSTNRDQHLWDRFSWNIAQTFVSSVYGIGSCHFPCNGDDDYDYSNPQTVTSYAPAWLNEFPEFNGKNGTTAQVNRETWGGPDYHRNFMIWWYQHMPHVAGRNEFDGYNRLNNWWEYIFNFNAWSESGGDHQAGGTPPPAVPYGATVYALTSNAGDDWRPQINAAGRVVWAGIDPTYHQMAIFSANDDGTDLRQHTSYGRVSELPRMNNVGQIVLQQYDNRDYEIYTVSADGSGPLRRITNNSRQDWHADINDSGRIVWEGFDGEDFEIYSANVDGTGLVQITNNTHSGVGQPRDDVWPRINNAGRVVWMGYDGSNWEIFSANADGTGLVNVSNNTYENEHPEISEGGQVVWHAWLDDYNTEVYIANAAGGSATRVTNNSVLDWWPQVNAGGDMVWMERAGNDWEIVRRTTDGGITFITNNSTHDQHPVIDDSGRIAWQGFDGHDWEIYVYEDGTIYQLTDNDYDDRAAAITTGGPVVWHGESAIGDPLDPDYQGPTTEIFVASTEDLLPPTIAAVTSVGDAERVTVLFSEPVEAVAAQTVANYAIDHGVTISAAELQPDLLTVLLTTTTLQTGVTYQLTVNNIEDLAGNLIEPGSTATFEHELAQRVTDGLVVLYDFEEGSGTTVNDVSDVGTPMNLSIDDLGTVAWTDGGLKIIDGEARVRTSGAALKVYDACVTTNEITIEAWIVPTSISQSGPARIVTLSPHSNSRNFTLGQGSDDGLVAAAYTARLRTTATSDNGQPAVETPAGVAATVLQHVVYTRDASGSARIYVDGAQVVADAIGGSLSNWANNYYLTLGNEFNRAYPWFGEFKLVAIFNRALTPAEVLQNFDAGVGELPPLCAGDMNCDGVVNYDDIDPFVAALSCVGGAPGCWDPACPWLNGDCDGDGNVTYADIDAFVARIGASCP